MKKIFFFLAFFFSAQLAQAEVTIFACEPHWASLAREIVGPKAQVVMGTRANEDPSQTRVTTELVKLIRTANMVFCTGNGLEVSWLDSALNKSANLVVLTKPENLLFAYDYAITKTSPYVHLNPNNILPIAAEFTRRIKIIDGLNAIYYQKSYEKFVSRWQKSVALWQTAAAPIRGQRIVVQNDNWSELTNWLGLEIAAKIPQQKTRLANNKLLENVLRTLKDNPASVIIFSIGEDKTSALWLSEKANIRVALLPFTVGGAANSADLFQLFSTTINLLRADCSRVVCPPVVISN